jgi:hypothetical protein
MAHRAVIAPKFQIVDGYWHRAYMEAEIEERCQRIEGTRAGVEERARLKAEREAGASNAGYNAAFDGA